MSGLWRSREAWVPALLKDRRYRGERVFLIIAIPVVLIVLAVMVAGFLLGGRIPAAIEADAVHPLALPPPKPDPAADLRSALDAGDVARAREALAGLPVDDLRARRGRAKLAMLAEEFSEARREWDGVITDGRRDLSEAEDLFLRGLCLYALDDRSAAGTDFAEAAARSPSSTLYANRHDLFLIGAGSRRAVAEKIRIGLELKNENLRMAWVMPHALIALEEGNLLLAELLLEQASRHFTQPEIECLLDDHSFDRFRSTPSLARYFVKSSAPNPQGTK